MIAPEQLHAEVGHGEPRFAPAGMLQGPRAAAIGPDGPFRIHMPVHRRAVSPPDAGAFAVVSFAAGASMGRVSSPVRPSASSLSTIASITGIDADVRRAAMACSSMRTPSTRASKLALLSVRLPCRTGRKQLSM